MRRAFRPQPCQMIGIVAPASNRSGSTMKPPFASCARKAAVRSGLRWQWQTPALLGRSIKIDKRANALRQPAGDTRNDHAAIGMADENDISRSFHLIWLTISSTWVSGTMSGDARWLRSPSRSASGTSHHDLGHEAPLKRAPAPAPCHAPCTSTKVAMSLSVNETGRWGISAIDAVRNTVFFEAVCPGNCAPTTLLPRLWQLYNPCWRRLAGLP
ncbi:MAG: hypothetical protein CM15mP60_0480 [Alphaproteobacteria bacterium]|nr:MAG: hypothetical protein CM15mP60_0480 [Alphaproteobacteria bacterium]